MTSVGARYHGGDGGNDPPRQPRNVVGGCQSSGAKRGRPVYTMEDFLEAYSRNQNRAFPIQFDTSGSYTPMGDNRLLFQQLLLNIVRQWPLTTTGYEDLPLETRNLAIHEICVYFEVSHLVYNEDVRIRDTWTQALHSLLKRTYRENKNKVKTKYYSNLVKKEVPKNEIRDMVPEEFEIDQWHELFDFYEDPNSLRRAEKTSASRGFQVVDSRQGTQSFVNLRHQYAGPNGELPSWIDFYAITHHLQRRLDMAWTTDVAAGRHAEMVRRRNEFIATNGRSPNDQEERNIMQDVLEFRWGHEKDFGKSLFGKHHRKH